MDQAQTQIVTLLEAQTIKQFYRECNYLATDEHPNFRDFVMSESGFIITNKRDEIIRGIHSGLLNKQSPGVILHGAYGSGKTVLMNNLVDLCNQSKEFTRGGEPVEYEQFSYGETSIDPIEVSLEDYDSPNRMLRRIFEGLVSSADTLSEDDLIDEFQQQKENLTASDLQALPSSQQERLEEVFDNPSSVADIAMVVKELSRGDIHDTLTWFTYVYQQETNSYPVICLDEFEQAFDIGPGNDEEMKLRAIVRHMIRKSVVGFEDFDDPPYLLIANTLPLQDWGEILNARSDLPDRVRDSLEYNIDLSREESKELFADLYRRYARPLLQDYNKEGWSDRLDADEGDIYVYPFTEKFLDFVLSISQAYRDESGDSVVRGFRDFKLIANEYFKRWDQNGVIDLDMLYRYGDEVREELGHLDRANLDRLPGRDSIEERIEDDFQDCSYTQRRVLFAVAKDGILYRNQSPALYTSDQLRDLAGQHEIDMSEEELSHLIDAASTQADYFDIDADGRLIFESDDLTEEAAPDSEATLQEEISQVVAAEDLRETSPIDLYQEWYDARTVFDISFDAGSSNYIEFDIDGQLNYTNKVYLCFKEIPEELQMDSSEDQPTAPEFIVCLSEADEDDDVAALYEVSERYGRAEDLASSLEGDLNPDIRHDQIDRDQTKEVLSTLRSEYPSASDFDRYILWTKLCLIRGLEEENPEDERFPDGQLRMLTQTNYLFSPVNLNDGLAGIYTSDFVLNRLGYNNSYNGKETMNLAYAVQHLKYEGALEFTDPDISEIMMPGYPYLGFDPMFGDNLRDILKKLEGSEPFVNDGDITDNYTANFQGNLDAIKEKLSEDDEVTEDEVYKLIFGTTEIDNVTRALIFLMFVIGDYNAEWILSDTDTIISVDSDREARWETIKRDLRSTVEKQVLKNARREDIDTDELVSLREAYTDSDEFPAAGRLDELEERCDTDLSVEDSSLDQRLKSLGSSAAFSDTNVPRYIAELRPLGQLETEVLFLITPAVEQLIDQLEAAERVYELINEVKELELTYSSLTGTDPDLNLNDIEVSSVTTVDDHYESSTVEELIEDLSIGDVLSEFSDDGRDLDPTVTELERHRRQIVPDVEDYDADNDISDLRSDKEFLVEEINREIESLEEQVESELKYLESQEERLPEGSSWPKQGHRVLNNCKDALDESATDFDYEQYKNPWNRWTDRIKQHIEEESYTEDEVLEILNKFGASESADTIIEAEEVDVTDSLMNLSDSDFEQVINALNREDDDIQSLRQTLMKQRVRNELGEDQ